MLAAALLLGAALPAVAQTAANPPDTMEARTAACAPCHGKVGEGTQDVYFPRIAGKPAGYLFNQLHAFHVGRRRYPPMNYLLEFLPEAYLQEIADYFAALRPPLAPPEAPTVAAVVARLVAAEPKAGQTEAIARLLRKVQSMSPEERDRLRDEHVSSRTKPDLA